MLSRLSLVWRLAALVALVVPLSVAAAMSWLPSKRYEATTWIIVDASRGSQAFAASEERRAGNEVVTYDQVLRTQLSIAGSEDVIRKAIGALLPTRLYPEMREADGGTDVSDREFATAKAGLSLSVEPNTFIIKVSFRHTDPALAARFANQLSAEYLARRSGLYSNEGDADFFRAQEIRYKEELRVASEALEKFGSQTSIYSISEQRRLLLEARYNAAKEASNNATQVARAESELNALKVQLQSLRSRTSLPAEIYGVTGNGPVKPMKRDDAFADDPPLLNIKIYQDSAARLVGANAELAGLRATQARRSEDLIKIDEQLQNIALNEARYSTLHRAVSQAETYIENLSKRAGEAKINNAWRSNEAFSSAQILQSAKPPLGASYPRPSLFFGAGLLVGVFLCASVIYFGQAQGAQRQAASRSAAVHAFDAPHAGRGADREAEHPDVFTAGVLRWRS